MGEEDGAVDALVSSMGQDGGQPPEAAAETRQGWLRRLGQLQSVAASAASTVGGIGSILPTSTHFGKSIAWPVVRNLACAAAVPFLHQFNSQHEPPMDAPGPCPLTHQQAVTFGKCSRAAEPVRALL